MAGCRAGALFGDDTNPIAGLMVGILSTVLLQSSSTTTSIVVSLVPSVVSAKQGIFLIMGANIGTTVTNTIVALGQLGDKDQLERAFAGATVHDCFNILTVIILLPLEVVTGCLYQLTKAMVKKITVKDGESWEGPISKIGTFSDSIWYLAKQSYHDDSRTIGGQDYYRQLPFHQEYCPRKSFLRK